MSQFSSSDSDVNHPRVEVVNGGDEPVTIKSQLQQLWSQFQAWFEPLPFVAKAAVTIGLFSLSLTLLTKVLYLVASLISVSILAVILFGLYQFLIKPSSSKLD